MSCESKLSKQDELDFARSKKMFEQLEVKQLVLGGGVFLDSGKVVSVVKSSNSK